jgi:hypothetical protein
MTSRLLVAIPGIAIILLAVALGGPVFALFALAVAIGALCGPRDTPRRLPRCCLRCG